MTTDRDDPDRSALLETSNRWSKRRFPLPERIFSTSRKSELLRALRGDRPVDVNARARPSASSARAAAARRPSAGRSWGCCRRHRGESLVRRRANRSHLGRVERRRPYPTAHADGVPESVRLAQSAPARSEKRLAEPLRVSGAGDERDPRSRRREPRPTLLLRRRRPRNGWAAIRTNSPAVSASESRSRGR